MAQSQVKFYRGNYSNYSFSKHKDGIYFAQDTGAILMNDKNYGMGDSSLNKVELVASEDAKLEKALWLPEKIISLGEAGTTEGYYLTNVAGNIKLALTHVITGKAPTSQSMQKFDSDGKQLPYAYNSVDGKNIYLATGDRNTNTVWQTLPATGQYLKFTYVTASGEIQYVYVNVSTFLAESEFKNGLQVSANGEVSVKTNDKYLTVDAEGVKTKGIDEAIRVGDLFNEGKKFTVLGVNVGSLKDGDPIDPNMSVSDLLEKMLQKVIDVSANAPTTTLSSSATKTVEAGTTITPDFAIKYWNGYYTGNAGYSKTFKSINLISEIPNTSSTSDLKWEMRVKSSKGDNFVGHRDMRQTTGQDAYATIKTTETSRKIGVESVTYHSEIQYGEDTYDKRPQKNNNTDSDVKVLAGTCKSDNITFTGMLAAFGGATATTWAADKKITSADIRAFIANKALGVSNTKNNWSKKGNFIVNSNEGFHTVVMAIPQDFKIEITSIKNEDSIGAEILPNFDKSVVSVNDAGGTAHNYDVYVFRSPVALPAIHYTVLFKNV